MADAADRGHEQHRARHDAGEVLGVVAGAARHAQRLARAARLGRRRDRRLEALVHERRRRLAHDLDPDRAAPVAVRLLDEALQLGLEALEHGRVRVADLEQRLGPARDDARRAGLERDTAAGPDRARSGKPGEAPVDLAQEAHDREAGVAAARHAGRAGVVLLACRREAVLPDRDDRRDDADLEVAALERVALLDMGLDIAGVSPCLELQARPAGKRGLVERLAQGGAVVAVTRLVDLVLGEQAHERARAEEGAEMPLLVAPGRDVDAEIGGRRVLGKGARGLEAVDDAERAVEPASMVLALEMRAGEHLTPRRAAEAEDAADAVDRGVEPGLGEAVGEPVPRLDVLAREGRAMHAGLVGAELRERAQVAEEAAGIDLRHAQAAFLRAGFGAGAAARLSNMPRPSVPPTSGSTRFSGCGIRPSTLRRSE